MEKQKELKKLKSPTLTLETLRVNETVEVPNFQRASLESTKVRVMDKSSKLFRFHKVNSTYFTITRTR